MKLHFLFLASLLPLLASCPTPDTQFAIGIERIASSYQLTDEDRTAIRQGIEDFVNKRFNAELWDVRSNQIAPNKIRICGFFVPRDVNGRSFDGQYFFAGDLQIGGTVQKRFSLITIDRYRKEKPTVRISGKAACGIR
jgi:hypothetical protein